MNTSSRHPTSPHLQIYRLPLTALLSITHRTTGVFLVIGAVLLVAVLAALAGGTDSYTPFQAFLQSWFGQLILFAITFSLYFHFCNGIRHLFWDVGMGFELETTDKTAKLAIVISIVLTVATWFVAAGVE
ncbi:MAG: succinate dehydrogenase, cytochrome b556 subunit [Gammaproteobacteria bacterium]|nr:succinate dehydrogenase, cytochrome b556 subunit [Gammaproteobacteria bacterium]